jgi:Tol biopolymer transport system component
MKRLPILLLLAAWVSAERLAGAETGGTDETQFLTNTRQLTFEGKRSGEGYFSPAGKALVFQSEREPGNPFYQIYLLDLESGDSHRVSTGKGKTTCAFFRPASDELLFASTHLDPEAPSKQAAEFNLRASGKQRRYSWDYDDQMDIFSAKPDGSDMRRLTDAPGYDAEGAYSPDGKLIVFCSLRRAYPTNQLSTEDLKRLETDPAWFGEIYLMDADGLNVRQLTHSPGYDGGPFFSPDGRRIIWRRFDDKGNADVYTMNLDGSDTRRLTDFGAMSWAPFFHPSGRYAIFTANKLGFSNFELYLVDALGEHEPVRVTFSDGFDGLPVFAPDGRRLCWTSNRAADGKSQLFLADWNHDAALAALAQSPRRPSAGAGAGQSSRGEQPHAFASGGESLVTSAAIGSASLSPEISTNDLAAIVGYLASDALEGRFTGSKGAELAADFIARQFRAAGLQPLGTNGGFFQPFEFNAGVRIMTNANRLSFGFTNRTASSTFEVERDFRPLSFTANSEAAGEVVFVGYGLSAPGKAGEGYDSYAGVNVSNRIALVLRYVPEEVDTKRRAELNRYAGLRYKAMLARERGASAVLFVTGPNSPNAGELVGLSSDGALSGSGIVAVSISSNVANALLAGSGKDLKTLQNRLDKEDPHAESGFDLPNVRVRVATSVEHLKKTDRNVLGFLSSAGGEIDGEMVLVGAHYDHLGLGEAGAMKRAGEEHSIHAGADDNASGTAAVLELVAACARERREHPDRLRRGIIFALWSGEEIGLIGSTQFAEHPPVPFTNIVAYLNFDMVGRLRENKLSLQGVGSSSTWRKLIERRNVAAGFNVALQDDPYLPTDTTSLYAKGTPVLNFFTGSHEDYHRPTDKPATLNYDGLERITRFARAILLDLVSAASRPDYLAVARSDASGGSRENLRAYLGTIPDYATEVAGVKLSGVRAGGPADKAGVRGGDIIVEFAGQKIANIYDYTYAMDAVKIGQPVSVIVVREGKRLPLKVTPEARK